MQSVINKIFKICGVGFFLIMNGCVGFIDPSFPNAPDACQISSNNACKYQIECFDFSVSKSCSDLGGFYKSDGEFKNINYSTHLFKKSCASNYFPACHYAGIAYDFGLGVEKNQEKAFDFYRLSCEGGHLEACVYMGYSYRDGEGVVKSIQHAKEWFGRACEGMNLEGCYSLGVVHEGENQFDIAKNIYQQSCEKNHIESCKSLYRMHKEGKGGFRDLEKAVAVYSNACNRGISNLCYTLAGIYFRGDDGIKQNISKSIIFLDMGCNQGMLDSCNDLGGFYLTGQGVEENASKAFDLFSRACGKGENIVSNACSNLGLMYMNGQGVQQNTQQALNFWERACNRQDGSMACRNLAVVYFQGKNVPKDKTQSVNFFQKACLKNDFMSCEAIFFWEDESVVSHENLLHALLVFDNECKQKTNDSNECKTVQAAYMKPAMFAVVQMGCDQKNFPWACGKLSIILNHGIGVPENKKSALFYLEKACNLGHGDSCFTLGMAYRDEQLTHGMSFKFHSGFEDFIKPNKEKSDAFLSKGCDAGYEIACNFTSSSSELRNLIINTGIQYELDPSEFSGKISNTLWSGPDSDGGTWFYYFKEDGILCYKEPNYVAPGQSGGPVYIGATEEGFICNGKWKQKGTTVTMEGGMANFKAEIKNNQLIGKGDSLLGVSWTWKAMRVKRIKPN